MIELAFVILLLSIIISVVLLIKSKEAFSKILFLGLIASLMVGLIVLFAVYTNQSMYLDVAIILAILGFMDVQFYTVYLRRKGDL